MPLNVRAEACYLGSLSCICICVLHLSLTVSVPLMTHKVLMELQAENMQKGIFTAQINLTKTYIFVLRECSPDFTHLLVMTSTTCIMSSMVLEELCKENNDAIGLVSVWA